MRDYRKELWIGVAAGVSAASNSTNPDTPVKWADKALKAFDERFPE